MFVGIHVGRDVPCGETRLGYRRLLPTTFEMRLVRVKGYTIVPRILENNMDALLPATEIILGRSAHPLTSWGHLLRIWSACGQHEILYIKYKMTSTRIITYNFTRVYLYTSRAIKIC